MSDFVWLSSPVPPAPVAAALRGIHRTSPPDVDVFSGTWGTLAATRNHYPGFAVWDTPSHLAVVVGGPVLTFAVPEAGPGEVAHAATRAIAERHLGGAIRWEEDLSGPFAFLILEKSGGAAACVTDLLGSISVFRSEGLPGLALGTHPGALAKAAAATARDPVSMVEFLLAGRVTYPFTMFRDFRVLAPATRHAWKGAAQGFRPGHTAYWQPLEGACGMSIRDAGAFIREGMAGHLRSVVRRAGRTAVFMSGGEDTRSVALLLPPECGATAITFADSRNREARLAEKVARVLGFRFEFHPRDPDHYAATLPGAADLMGPGRLYFHCHAYGLHIACGLADYGAVLGGFLADTLFKARFILKLIPRKGMPFMPHIAVAAANPPALRGADMYPAAILRTLEERRNAHFERIREIRPVSAAEWFNFWPLACLSSSGTFEGNRRLFRGCEPFQCSEAIKAAAFAPQEWKLNRRLYLAAFGPLLRRTPWLPHAEGHLPGLPWYANFLPQAAVWAARRMAAKAGRVRGEQGSWSDWNRVLRSDAWSRAKAAYRNGLDEVAAIVGQPPPADDRLTNVQRVQLLQVCYELAAARGKSAA